MMLTELNNALKNKLGDLISTLVIAHEEITLEIYPENLLAVAKILRDDAELQFSALMDLCGIDYLAYGKDEWMTENATRMGFDRAVARHQTASHINHETRFAVVYHLLSYQHNHRLRLKVLLKEAHLVIPSVIDIWPAANWYEREAFDLFGLLFDGHPDLRRILTDYGFIGHPFRKDFPVSGTVEVRYDAAAGRVIYEPVDIEPRTLVPKVIRKDNRYLTAETSEDKPHG